MEDEIKKEDLALTPNNMVQGLEGFDNSSKVKTNIITTITDEKKLFNLETRCDERLNDCVGEKIRVVDMLCKVIEKPLDEPIINEETGEIEKDREYKMITILIDETGKSYVTASKTFFFNWKKLCQLWGEAKIKDGVDIEITKVQVKNSGNKALSFELV